jgi:hypothetical protein
MKTAYGFLILTACVVPEETGPREGVCVERFIPPSAVSEDSVLLPSTYSSEYAEIATFLKDHSDQLCPVVQLVTRICLLEDYDHENAQPDDRVICLTLGASERDQEERNLRDLVGAGPRSPDTMVIIPGADVSRDYLAAGLRSEFFRRQLDRLLLLQPEPRHLLDALSGVLLPKPHSQLGRELTQHTLLSVKPERPTPLLRLSSVRPAFSEAEALANAVVLTDDELVGPRGGTEQGQRTLFQ